MKKMIYLVALLLIMGCAKENPAPQLEPGTVTFWTKETGNWNLILDGVEYGKIKRANNMPVCGDEAFQKFTLSAGKHTADAKSLDGFAWGNPITFEIPSGGCIQVKLP